MQRWYEETDFWRQAILFWILSCDQSTRETCALDASLWGSVSSHIKWEWRETPTPQGSLQNKWDNMKLSVVSGIGPWQLINFISLLTFLHVFTIHFHLSTHTHTHTHTHLSETAPFLPIRNKPGISLMVQWLRFHTPNAGPGSVLGQETGSHIPQLKYPTCRN